MPFRFSLLVNQAHETMTFSNSVFFYGTELLAEESKQLVTTPSQCNYEVRSSRKCTSTRIKWYHQ